jgi:membrane associated rhomboid family serine protease
MAEAEPAPLRMTTIRALAGEWSHVLASQGLHPGVVRRQGAFALVVPEAERERAEAMLVAYELENPAAPAEAPLPPGPDWLAGSLIFAGLLLFFAVTGPRDPEVGWFAHGSADAERILAGETWRAATALTLHADLPHVAGNALAGLIFVSAVCGALGFGAGSALVFATGFLGNLANARFQVDQYSSVGASTAIFGAVGILAALAVARHRHRGARGHRALVPLAAGLGLLAMLGTSERSDLSGHLFGLLAGTVLGLLWSRSVAERPGIAAQWGLASATAVALLACWARALP